MARFRLRAQKIQLSERDVRDACLMLLNLRHYWYRRMNSGLFRTVDGRWHTEGQTGDPDYAVLHASFPGFLLEFKRPGSFSLLSICVRPDLPARIALHLRPAVIEEPPSNGNGNGDGAAA